MNIEKMFQAQKVLDEHINENHENIENRLEKKILAMLVEVGECANEWRGFKFWSNDQQPRKEKLLEELVDVWHFVLSIGNDIGFNNYKKIKANRIDSTLCDFNNLYLFIMDFYVQPSLHQYQWLFIQLIDLSLSLGFTLEEIEEAYYKKNKINHERQENGY